MNGAVVAGKRGYRYHLQPFMAKRNLNPPKTFEDAVAELEGILTRVESGELGLEESLGQYERGSFLIQYCRGVLNSAEKQIELIGRSSDGAGDQSADGGGEQGQGTSADGSAS